MKYKIKRYLAEIEESLGYVDVYIDDLDNPNSMEQIREYSKDILLNACKLSMILEEDRMILEEDRMTTNELKQALSELDIKIESIITRTYLKDSKERIIASVDNEYVSIIDTKYISFMGLDDHRKNKILKILTRYATTPIEEREEREEYYWE